MKKLLLLLILAISTVAHAADNWKLSDVVGAGYIYYTAATATIDGTVRNKVYSRLEFICSTKGGGESIVAIFLDKGIDAKENLIVSTFIDNKMLDTPAVWTNTADMVYRPVSEVPELVKAVKVGKTAKFLWHGNNNTIYITAFNISGFDFANFTTKCGLQQ